MDNTTLGGTSFQVKRYICVHAASCSYLGPPPGPPLKSDPFCVGGLTQDGNFSVRSGPGVFLGFRRPSIVLRMLLCVRCRSNLSRNSSVRAAPLRFIFLFFLNFFESCL